MADDTTTRETRLDLLVLLVIFIAGLAATVVFFKYLDSSASTRGANGLAVGGALLGGLLTWSSLGTLYLQISRNSRTYERLSTLVDELGHELVRKSPVPVGFEREIDDRHGLVLSRPVGWRPMGGILFDWVAPSSSAEDYLSAQFRVYRFPRSEENESFAEEMRRFAAAQARTYGGTLVEESIRVGSQSDEESGLACPKFTIQCYAVVTHDPSAPPNGDPPSLSYLTREEVLHIAGRDLEVAIRGRIPQRFEAAKNFAAAKVNAKLELDRRVEAFALDQTGGLPETIRQIIAAYLSSDAEAVGDSAGVIDGPPSGVMSDAASGVESTVGALANRRQIVLPVNRVLVAADHANLAERFLFEFVDNTGDFLATSREMNDVIRTVRFIQ